MSVKVMRESVIEKKVCDHVVAKGGIAYKFTSPQRRSVPDRLILLPNGEIFFIEFKTPAGRLSSGQDREINRIMEQGQQVFVINDITIGKNLIDAKAE